MSANIREIEEREGGGGRERERGVGGTMYNECIMMYPVLCLTWYAASLEVRRSGNGAT